MTVHKDTGLKKVKIKKFFRPRDDIKCVFCQKVGHHCGFCPCKPTTPEVKVEFVEGLLGTPKIKLHDLENRNWGESLDLVFKRGVFLNRGNPWGNDQRPFSSLRKKLGFWKSIGADNSVLSWISYGFQFRFQREPFRRFFLNPSNISQHEEFIDKEILAHVTDGSFVEEKLENVKVVNPFLISVNSSGKPRRCDDLRYVNGHLCSPMFKMQSLGNDVPNIALPGHHMFTRDLEKAYYKIPIEEKSTYYQCFFWKGKYYRSLVLLFGLCQAPFVFTKVCRVVVRFFGALMIRVVNFVDDFLFCEEPNKLEDLQKFVDTIFHLLGWTFSLKDNQVGERVNFLGFVVDSIQRRFFITDKVRVKVLRLIEVTCQSIVDRRLLSVQDIRRVTGKLVSLKLAIPSVTIWMRDLLFYLPKDPETDETRECIVVGEVAIEGLMVIHSMVRRSNGSPFVAPVVERDAFVDSGEIGWGASILGLELHGVFEEWAIGQSSTFRELVGLKQFISEPLAEVSMKGKVVRFNMDSKCAIANLLHAGPVQSLLPIVKEIWKIFEVYNTTPVFRWVSRETPGLRRVDDLSKRVSFTLDPMFKVEFEKERKLPVMVVDHNKIPEALGWIVPRGITCFLLVPKWEGKSWWPLLRQHAKELVYVNRSHIVIRGSTDFPGWEFVLARM